MSATRPVKLVPTGGKDLRHLIVPRVALVSYALEQSTPALHDQQKRNPSHALIALRLTLLALYLLKDPRNTS
jgi:hypothetical protein